MKKRIKLKQNRTEKLKSQAVNSYMKGHGDVQLIQDLLRWAFEEGFDAGAKHKSIT